MATSTVSRLAPANARDGVNTRTKENWARVATQPQKTICRSDMIIGLGNPAVTNWGDMMTGMYENRSAHAAMPAAFSKMRLYIDMSDEPGKYGDDILEWEELDEQLRAGPDRAEVEAYWRARDAREKDEARREQNRDIARTAALRATFLPIAKQVAVLAMKRWIDGDIKRIVARFKGSATKIQALVRGYQARCKDAHQDCCMCLSHRVSPLKTSVGYMCRDCAVLGPYQDLVQEDPWNWHRADFVDEAPNHHVYDTCNWCTHEFIAPLWNGDYCSYECEWKDRTA